MEPLTFSDDPGPIDEEIMEPLTAERKRDVRILINILMAPAQ